MMRRIPKQLLALTLSVVFVGGGLSKPAAADTKIFLPSAIKLDQKAKTVTLPLFRGSHNGDTVWYIVTESSNRDDAERRGVIWAPKLTNALGTAAVQRVRRDNGVVNFSGTVDFAPTRVVVPGPTGFPPNRAAPGAVGDSVYSPLITTGNGIVLNASQVMNSSGRHDSITNIDVNAKRVTLSMFAGFYNGKDILYLHQEGSTALLAALEGSTFAPNLNAAPGIGSNDKDTSARSAIIPVVNGPRGRNNPERQGLQSALLGQGDPLNVTQETPGSNRYSPVWDVHLVEWTNAAIAAGEREQLTSESEIANAVQKGFVLRGGPGPANEKLGGLRAAGFISNCPVVAQF